MTTIEEMLQDPDVRLAPKGPAEIDTDTPTAKLMLNDTLIALVNTLASDPLHQANPLTRWRMERALRLYPENTDFGGREPWLTPIQKHWTCSLEGSGDTIEVRQHYYQKTLSVIILTRVTPEELRPFLTACDEQQLGASLQKAHALRMAMVHQRTTFALARLARTRTPAAPARET